MENIDCLKEAQYHAWFHHHDADGWITIAKKTKNGFRQYHYHPTELAHKLTKWIGEDVYFSQNTFYKPFRRLENIRQLRALYVDIDSHLFNFEPDWVLGKLDLEFFKTVLPEPNLIIFSGRGIVLIWFIEPVPHQALPLWQSIQNYFVEQLKELGGDTKAIDAARVFRIAGSVNSKNGEVVSAQYRHDYRYRLRDIQQEYLPELTPSPKKKGRKPKILQLHNIYRLHHSRLQDLIKLVELRNYDVQGYRELICFLYRYWSCCVLQDTAEALRHTLELNQEFVKPLPENEVVRATRSAEKAWEAKSDKKANEIARSKGYPGAGYNLRNSKIIDWLGITREEQEHLATIIDGVEKRRRNTEYQRTKRRKHGIQKREDYIKQQHDKTDDKLFKVKELLEQGLKQNEIAQILELSKGRISQLVKELKKV
ncbi:replication protein [Bacillus taeanensis]|uniref:Replication protein n=1 Tax=Bacillus taeanensis TaxID=273032 RepID=A0A366XT13_9BACI|nr:replication protein [Bacillus taeanensis]RBW67284.1 replication protein [Bacillus taeanensis]